MMQEANNFLLSGADTFVLNTVLWNSFLIWKLVTQHNRNTYFFYCNQDTSKNYYLPFYIIALHKTKDTHSSSFRKMALLLLFYQFNTFTTERDEWL